MDPTSTLPPGEWLALALGPLGALVLAISWIVILLRANTALHQRNEQLSSDFIRHIENGSVERVKLSDAFLVRHDSTIRALLEHFTWLSNVRPISGKSSRDQREPQPLPKLSGEQLASKKTPPQVG